MPRTPINYSNTIIYKLVCNDLSVTDIYVGHTTNFTNRKRDHKCSCNNQNGTSYNYKVYQTIRENGGWKNWSMIQIEECCLNNSNEAKSRERYWIETLKSNLNSYIPNRSQKEYNVYNRETINKKQREYNEINRETIYEKMNNYYTGNKTKINQRTKKYYNDNKEQILKQHAQPYTCECGSNFRYSEKFRHFKTLKHQTYLADLKSKEPNV
jgi:glutamate synthase domain-containing protein 2